MADKPSIAGRDRYIIELLAKALLREAQKKGDYTPLRNTDSRRGFYFEIALRVNGEPSGHVARVTVELDRYEGQEVVEHWNSYLRYDHSAGPGPREDEFIGPFPETGAAVRFRHEHFAKDAPVLLEYLTDPPPADYTMTPEAAAEMQERRL